MEIVKVQRPWGSFEQFTHNQNCTVKLLFVSKGQSLSLQLHHRRDEFWKVLSGSPFVEIAEEKHQAKAGDEFVASRETAHRISAPADETLILEISTGSFDENDEVRLEDEYNRS